MKGCLYPIMVFHAVTNMLSPIYFPVVWGSDIWAEAARFWPNIRFWTKNKACVSVDCCDKWLNKWIEYEVKASEFAGYIPVIRQYVKVTFCVSFQKLLKGLISAQTLMSFSYLYPQSVLEILLFPTALCRLPERLLERLITLKECS